MLGVRSPRQHHSSAEAGSCLQVLLGAPEDTQQRFGRRWTRWARARSRRARAASAAPLSGGAARGHRVTSDPRAEQDPARRPRSCHPLTPPPCPALCALSHVRCWESQLPFAPSLSQHHVHCTDAQCVPITKHLFIYG